MKLTKKQEKNIKETLSKYEIRYDCVKNNPSEFYIYFRKSGIKAASWDKQTVGVRVHYNPTSNCQLFSIGSFENIYRLLNFYKEDDLTYKIMIQNMFSIISNNFSGKKMLFLDTKNENYETFRKTVKNFSNFIPSYSFVYKSSNRSKMRNTILKIDHKKVFASNDFLKYYMSNKRGDTTTFTK